jgi:hypothetical protein
MPPPRFRTDAALDVGGLAVPRGTCSPYAWVKDPDAWALIVNKETGQSGLDDKAKLDLGRVKMTCRSRRRWWSAS